MLSSTWLGVLLLLPFLGGVAALCLPYGNPAWARRIAMLACGGALAVLGGLSAGWTPEAPPRLTAPWVPQMGLVWSLWLDGAALFWAWLVLGIGFLVLHYAGHYMDPADAPRRFYSAMILFIGAMLGLVISANVLLMVVFWEVTSVSSFLLISHWSDRKEAIAGARRALLVTGLGGLCLMAGVAVVFWILTTLPGEPSLEWADLWARRAEIIGPPAASVALGLMLIGAFTKSAQFPFHFWLPGAMEAPTPVSALLHAATMVKAGIYLLGRMYPVFSDMHLWIIVAVAGVLTVLIGGYGALVAYDLKQLLAWSTVSQLGLLTSFYGFGAQRLKTGNLLEYDLALVLSHAMFKGALFMLVGVVDHATHTRDWRRLGGLWRRMPWTAAMTAAGCASMAGLPFTFGFVAKKLWLGAGAGVQDIYGLLGEILVWFSITGSFFTMAYCLRLVVLPFLGHARDEGVARHAHEGSWRMLAAPALLVTLCVVGGLYVPSIKSVLARTVHPEFFSTEQRHVIAFFKSADTAALISMVTYFVAGPVLFLLSFRLEAWHRRAGEPSPVRVAGDWLLGPGLERLAGWTHRLVQSPSLRRHLRVVLVSAGAILLVPLIRGGWQTPGQSAPVPPDGLAAFLVACTGVCVAIVIWARDTMHRLLSLGLIGLVMMAYFVEYEAPDLAITMVLVELAILLVFLFMLRYLGASTPPRRRLPERLLSGGIAAGFAALMAVMTYYGSVSPEKRVPVAAGQALHADYYLTHSKYAPEPGAHKGGGNNVVNVILVDFRGFDTLGEITVLALAVLGVSVLSSLGIRARHRGRLEGLLQQGDAVEPAEQLPGLKPFLNSRMETGRSIIMRQTAPIVAIIALTFSGVLFVAGHNAPGGGFIGGLLAAAAAIPFIVSSRPGEPYPGRIANPGRLVPVGLLIAALTGVGAMVAGHEFLRSGYAVVRVPLAGEVGLSSAMLFDAGVYILVVGTALGIIKAFGVGRH
ncbi:MAG: proton-conducting transporter membrane subunit [Candidatus Sumerlaeaceae bacterium]|nr:proton-conducting transporter membrane subunit [Candidatus Sumerlaeaceae bacterium]